MVNSEFEPLSEEELKKEAQPMIRWECDSCGHRVLKWGEAPKTCEKCSGASFKRIINAYTVPATTGFEIELSYDNLHTIDSTVDSENEIEQQNRDLKELEKARR